MTIAKVPTAAGRIEDGHRWRSVSHVLGAASLLVPAACLLALRAGLLQLDGEFCGMSALGVVLLSYVACFALSVLAVTMGAIGYRALPMPRPRWRGVELLVTGLPALAMAGIGLAVAILE